EVDTRYPEAAAVARTFEFVFGRQVVRRAPEMRTGHAERVEAGGVLLDVVGRSHEPYAVLLFPPLVDANPVLVRKSRFELLRRLVQHVGKHEAAGRGQRGRGCGGESTPGQSHPGAARQ